MRSRHLKTIEREMTTTNTLTTSGAGTAIKTDLVLFRGLNNSIYMDAHPGGVLFYDDVAMDAMLPFSKINTASHVERTST